MINSGSSFNSMSELVAFFGEKSALSLRYCQYPTYIKQAMEDSLTVFCLKHDIKEDEMVELLSELVDDVAFSIEMALIDNKKNELTLGKNETS